MDKLTFSALFAILLASTKGDHTPVYMDEVTNGQEVNLTGEIISHRGYPSTEYPPDINTRVSLPSLDYSLTNIIILTFDFFDISDFFYYEGDDLNSSDFYNDNTCSQSDKLFVTGRNLCNNAARYPGVGISTRRVLSSAATSIIQFSTNSDIYTAGGFVLQYTVASAIYPSLNPYQNGNSDLLAPEGFIVSHAYYPEFDYFRRSDTRLILRGLQSGQNVALDFHHFDLYYTANAPGCNQDFLEVVDISNTDLGYIRFCDDPDYKPLYNRTYYVAARSNSITFRFASNDYNSVDKGFLFKYTVLPLSATTPEVTPTRSSPTTTSPNTGSSTPFPNTTQSNKGNVTDALVVKPRPSKKGNNGAAIGAGVGVSVIILIVIAVVIFIIFKKRKDKKPFSPAHTEHIYDLPPGVERRNRSQNTPQISVVTPHNSYDYYNLPDVVAGSAPSRKASKSRRSSAADNKAYVQSNKHKKSEYILAYQPSINEGANHERVIVATRGYDSAEEESTENAIYDLPADTYQAVGNGGQLYENLATIRRQQEEKDIADEYGVVMASTKSNFKRKPSRTSGLVDNDLYGS